MKFKKMKIIFLTLCFAIVLSGCQDENTGNQNDDTLSVGVASLSGTFNPIYTVSVYDSYVTDLVYDSLLTRDYDGNLVASLAKELPDISADYKTYTFHLKDDVKFSNGNLLTTEDVAFSFTVLADSVYDGPYSSLVNNIEGFEEYHNNEADSLSGIEVIDETTIAFHFKEGYRSNIDNLANLGIMCKRSYPDYEKGNLEPLKKSINKPIGSGPYMLKDWNSDTGAVLVKNERYDRDGYAIETVNIKPVNASSMVLQLEKNEIDVLAEVNDPELISVGSNHNDLRLNAYPKASISWLTMNCANGVTADVNVRKALTLAFDREGIVNNYFACDDCDEKVAYVPKIFQNPISSLNEYVMGTKSIDGLEDDSYNLKAAKKLLEESGWIKGKNGIRYKDGNKLTVKLLVAEEQPISDTLVTVLQNDWKSIGVDLKVANIEFNSMIAKVSNNEELDDWNTFVLSSTFSSDDLDSIYTMFHSTSNEGRNLARVNNQNIDAILDEGRAELNIDNVDSIYLKAATLIHNEYAYIPFYGNNNFDIYHKRLTDFKTSSYYSWTKALKDAKLK